MSEHGAGEAALHCRVVTTQAVTTSLSSGQEMSCFSPLKYPSGGAEFNYVGPYSASVIILHSPTLMAYSPQGWAGSEVCHPASPVP